MRKLSFLLIFTCLILTESLTLQSQSRTISRLIFQETKNSMELRLSNLMKDVRFVPLETNDSSLIGTSAKFIVGNKYIISITREKVLQFSLNGQYLKCLTRRGRGPEEYLGMSCYQTDKDEKSLYFSQPNDNKISRIDLSSGKYRSPILLPKGIKAGFFSLINDNRIAVFTSRGAVTDYFVYYQDTLGHIIEGIPLKRNTEKVWQVFNSLQPVKWGNKLYFYDNAICGDTIFLIDNLQKTPYLTFDGGKKIEMESFNSDGFSSCSFLISPAFCLFNNFHLKKSGRIVTPIETKFYMITDTRSDLFEIRSFVNDYSGGAYSGNDLYKLFDLCINQVNQIISFHIDAIEFQKNTKASNFSSLNKIYQQKIQDILKYLTIYDNPVLIFGKIP